MHAEPWLLRLYIAGRGAISRHALANLERICHQHITGRYHIEVIDVLEYPVMAREHGIVAVPMVVRETPLPIRKAVGDFSAAPRTLFGLQI